MCGFVDMIVFVNYLVIIYRIYDLAHQNKKQLHWTSVVRK